MSTDQQLPDHIGREFEEIDFENSPCSPESHDGPICPVIAFQDGCERVIDVCSTCGLKIESKPFEDAIGVTIEGVGKTLKRFRKTDVGEHEISVRLPSDVLRDTVAENGGDPENFTVTSAGVGGDELKFRVVPDEATDDLPSPAGEEEA